MLPAITPPFFAARRRRPPAASFDFHAAAASFRWLATVSGCFFSAFACSLAFPRCAFSR